MFRIVLLLFVLCTPFSSMGIGNDTSPNPANKEAKNYHTKGLDFSREAKFDSALFYLKKTLPLYYKVGDWSNYFKAEGAIASVFLKKAQYDSAFFYYSRALDLADSLLDKNDLTFVIIYHGMGNYFFRTNSFDQARYYYTKALNFIIQHKGKDFPRIADEYLALGAIYYKMGKYQKALNYFRKAEHIWKKNLGDLHPKLSFVYGNIGNCYSELGMNELALRYYERNHSILKMNYGENNPQTLLGLFGITTIYAKTGDYEEALKILTYILPNIENSYGKQHPFTISILNNMANVYALMENYIQAEKIFRQILSIEKKMYNNKNLRMANNWANLANIYHMQARYTEALDFYKKALVIKQELLGADHPNIANTVYNNMAITYTKMKDYDNAVFYYNKSLKILNGMPVKNKLYLADTYNGLADVYFQKEEYTTALQHSQKALHYLLPEFTDTDIYKNPTQEIIENSLPELANVLERKADIFYARYTNETQHIHDLKSSVLTYKLCTDVLDRIKISYHFDESKMSSSQRTHYIYKKALAATYELYKKTKEKKHLYWALQAAERNRFSLLNEIMQNSLATRYAHIPDSLRERESWLRISINRIENDLLKLKTEQPPADSQAVSALESRFVNAKIEYNNLINLLEKQYPRYYRLKYGIRIPSLDNLQATVSKNEAVLEYFLGDSSLYIFLLSKNQFTVFNTPFTEKEKKIILNLIRSLKTYDKETFLQNAFSAYKLLISPLEKEIANYRRLRIIPDDVLSYVPFEVLIANKGPADDFTQQDYLVRSFEISYYYSMSFMYRLKEGILRSDQKTTQGFLGFAPVFSDDMQNGYILASKDDDFRGGILADSLNRSLVINQRKYRSLKFSEKEIRSIIHLFDSKHLPAAGYFYNDATEENFKKNCSDYKYIHIATHTLMNDNYPKLSGLIFAQPDKNPDENDGVLYSGETYNLALNADLVVLSSCESGLGKLISGEGLIALTRGFLYSGARNMIVSLWKISDKMTPELMNLFYRNVLDGREYSSALRQAKLKMIEDPLTAFPRNWAAFILIGK